MESAEKQNTLLYSVYSFTNNTFCLIATCVLILSLNIIFYYLIMHSFLLMVLYLFREKK